MNNTMNKLIDKINKSIETVSLEAFDKAYSYKLLYFYKGQQEVINTMKLEAKDKLAHVLAYMGYRLYHNPLNKARDKYNAYKEKK
jgi:hypothetical protein